MSAQLMNIFLVCLGAFFGVVLMALLYMARSPNGVDDGLLDDLEAANLSLTRVEDGGDVFWMCSTGSPRVLVGDASTNPRLAILSAINFLSEKANGR